MARLVGSVAWRDLRHADNALEDEDYEWAAFASQQASEKALEALIFAPATMLIYYCQNSPPREKESIGFWAKPSLSS